MTKVVPLCAADAGALTAESERRGPMPSLDSTIYGPGLNTYPDYNQLPRRVSSQPEGSILDRARARLDWVEKEIGRLDSLKEEAAMLKRMIAAAEAP